MKKDKEIKEENMISDNVLKNGRKIGYARVSTKSQLENNSLDIQEAELRKNGCTEVIREQFTGKTTERPEFVKLLADLKPGDCLVVCKLDRFARTTLEGMQTMQDLLNRNIVVEILNFGPVQGGFSSNNKLMFQIMLAFAEYERDVIVERCAAGKEWAKQQPGFKEGRPLKYSPAQINDAINLLTVMGGNMSYSQVERLTGISSRTLMRKVKEVREENMR